MAIRKEMVNLNELVDSFMEENKLSLKNKKLKVDIKPLDSAAATLNAIKTGFEEFWIFFCLTPLIILRAAVRWLSL